MEILRHADRVLEQNDPTDRLPFLRARFDAGLAFVHYPTGSGGLGAARELQQVVDAAFASAGAPDNDPDSLPVGLGMAAPTIVAHGTPAQCARHLRPLWTGEEVWCQLFSEPGAGSDLAGLATRAVQDGDEWIVSGQKVWTSMAREADWAILLARTDPNVPKHAGLTYFILDMSAPGVEVRPLRQMTGDAEFNEVFLNDVRVPDTQRVGEIGDGWRVAQTTLFNERVALGGDVKPRESGAIAAVARTWRERRELRDPVALAELMRLWVNNEAMRLTSARLAQQMAAGEPGPEGSAIKLEFARLTQEVSGFELELLRGDGLRYDDWLTDTWPEERAPGINFFGRDAGYRYLRAKANSIEGGTSEVLRNIISERVLGLPVGERPDKTKPWKDLPR
ncbi:acyl-CoA dehydrogenase [Rhodococcus sp. 14C212]|uniref:acyl-CoA dehydrogenase family protein n=1 Tax=Rhodococcus sp. 14C212 TaxID=2711209 RepID=UPI0013ED5F9B|nr:acyl-CoA dehydrogenase family protein [Rhodococcus sp. 14C212]NGP06734.1 acyl-CoA dehydrogenase [Rhodococcus sp. 14C212]